MSGPVTDAAAVYYPYWNHLAIGAAVVLGVFGVLVIVQLERLIRKR